MHCVQCPLEKQCNANHVIKPNTIYCRKISFHRSTGPHGIMCHFDVMMFCQIWSPCWGRLRWWYPPNQTCVDCYPVCVSIKGCIHRTGKQEQGKSERFDSCYRPSNLTQIGFKLSISQPVWPWNLMDDPKQGKSEGFNSCDRPSNLKLDSNRKFFRPCDREILWMTSKNNRALLLYYVKFCASFQIHWWIQTGFTVQKRSMQIEIGDMLSRVTLKFDGWPSKTIGHLFYATSNLVQYFVAIGEFKLELQSGNAQSGSNSTICRAVRPWNLTGDLAKQ